MDAMTANGTAPAAPPGIDAATGRSTEPIRSAAADRGQVAMEALSLCRDYRLQRGSVLHAVDAVSFSLFAGAVVALVGESGSGKSTIAKLLAGQERLTSGSISLDGAVVHTRGRRAFRRYKRQVQLVFQDPFSSLNPVHTVRYHLERPVRIHQRRRSNAEIDAELVDLMTQVRLTPAEQFLAKYPHELSGGQRQRVSVARALAARPTVLLADEPVSMLDVSIRLEMLNVLADLRDRYRLALLYITHDIASARYFADEVLVMYAGNIVERGPAEALTQQPAHPYTQLLVASAPDPDDLGSVLRVGAKGSTAGAGEGAGTTSGCRFHPRCPYAVDRCRVERPPLLRVSPARSAACWRLDVTAPSIEAEPLRAEEGR
jgi:peptide/nickel transport system ATP-binding protein